LTTCSRCASLPQEGALMLWNSEQKGQLPDMELERVIDRIMENDKRHAAENSSAAHRDPRVEDELRGWTRMGLKDILTALYECGYGLVKVTVGTFKEL
jgi:hypothetical protein